jgi:tryptophan-rich sensory protein
MSIDHSEPRIYHLLGFKSSHRSIAEQAVGASIFILISVAFQCLSNGLIQLSLESAWLQNILLLHRTFFAAVYSPAWTCYHLLFAAAMWLLWRRYSLRVLKLELALFISQFILQTAWSLSFFVFHEPRIALATLLFLCSNSLLATLVYWKKERLSGQALLPPFVWIFFLHGGQYGDLHS